MARCAATLCRRPLPSRRLSRFNLARTLPHPMTRSSFRALPVRRAVVSDKIVKQPWQLTWIAAGSARSAAPLFKGGDGNRPAAGDPGDHRTVSALQSANFVHEDAPRVAGRVRSVPEGLGTVAGKVRAIPEGRGPVAGKVRSVPEGRVTVARMVRSVPEGHVTVAGDGSVRPGGTWYGSRW